MHPDRPLRNPKPVKFHVTKVRPTRNHRDRDKILVRPVERLQAFMLQVHASDSGSRARLIRVAGFSINATGALCALGDTGLPADIPSGYINPTFYNRNGRAED